jgi:hypothetical protein
MTASPPGCPCHAGNVVLPHLVARVVNVSLIAVERTSRCCELLVASGAIFVEEGKWFIDNELLQVGR